MHVTGAWTNVRISVRRLIAVGLFLVMLAGCDTPLTDPGDAGVGPVQVPHPDAPLNQIQIRGNLRSDWHPDDVLTLAEGHPFEEVSRAGLREQMVDDGARALHFGFLFQDAQHEVGPIAYYYNGAGRESFCVTMTSCLNGIESYDAELDWVGPIVVLFEHHRPATFFPERADEYSDEMQRAAGYPYFRYIYQLEYLTGVVPREQIFTPADLQGDAATLREAVQTDGWPSLAELDGKFIFVLINKGEIRDDYLIADWRPLFGFGPEDQRVFLVADSPEDDHAAFFSFDGPEGVAEAREMAEAGFMVHAEGVDADTMQAYAEAGAHVLTTVHMEDVGFEETARCNPVAALPGCFEPGPLPQRMEVEDVVDEGGDAP